MTASIVRLNNDVKVENLSKRQLAEGLHTLLEDQMTKVTSSTVTRIAATLKECPDDQGNLKNLLHFLNDMATYAMMSGELLQPFLKDLMESGKIFTKRDLLSEVDKYCPGYSEKCLSCQDYSKNLLGEVADDSILGIQAAMMRMEDPLGPGEFYLDYV